jgi:ribosomal protein S18 acetylase RimI-like enzyme
MPPARLSTLRLSQNMRSVIEGVEIIDLRHYTSGSLRSLLSLECELWARTMAWDYQSSAEMILRYIDSKILPGYVAMEGGRVVGYTFFVYESTKGVIGDLFVSVEDSVQQADIRSRLLTHAIETLQQTPGIHRVEAQLLVHDAGVLGEPFAHQGFIAHPRVFMRLPLEKIQPARSDERIAGLEAIEIRHWAEADFQPAAGLITACYAGHIDSEINDQYRSAAGSLRFLSNIVRFPGCGVFDNSSSYVAVSRKTGMLIGLLLCSRVRSDVGHVTQVCVLPEYRGRRLGEELMHTCTDTLRSRNFTELSLTVTQANTRAVELYKRLGFQTKRIFDAFVWEG